MKKYEHALVEVARSNVISWRIHGRITRNGTSQLCEPQSFAPCISPDVSALCSRKKAESLQPTAADYDDLYIQCRSSPELRLFTKDKNTAFKLELEDWMLQHKDGKDVLVRGKITDALFIKRRLSSTSWLHTSYLVLSDAKIEESTQKPKSRNERLDGKVARLRLCEAPASLATTAPLSRGFDDSAQGTPALAYPAARLVVGTSVPVLSGGIVSRALLFACESASGRLKCDHRLRNHRRHR